MVLARNSSFHITYRQQADDDSADTCYLVPTKKKSAKNIQSAFKGLKVFPLAPTALGAQNGAVTVLRDTSATKPNYNLSTSQLDAGSPNSGGTNSPLAPPVVKQEEDVANPHPKMLRRRFSDCATETGGPILKEHYSIKFMVETKKAPRRSMRPDNSSESAMYDSDKAINMDASQSRVQASKMEMSNTKLNNQTPGSHFGKKNGQQIAHSQKIYPAANSKVLDSIYWFRKKNHAEKMGVLNLASPFMESAHKQQLGQITDPKQLSRSAQIQPEGNSQPKSNAWVPFESVRSVKDPSRHKTVNMGSVSSEQEKQRRADEEALSGLKPARKIGKAVTSSPFRVTSNTDIEGDELGESGKRGMESKRAKTQVKKLTIQESDDQNELDDQPDMADTPVMARKVDSSVEIEATPPSIVKELNPIVKIDATGDPSFRGDRSQRADHNFQYSDGSEKSEERQKRKINLGDIQEKMLVVEVPDGREIQTPGFATFGKVSQKKSVGRSSSEHDSEEERDGSPNFSNQLDGPPKTSSLAQMHNTVNPSQFQRKRTQRMTVNAATSQNTLQAGPGGPPRLLGAQRSQERLKTFLVRGALSPSQAFQSYLKEEEKFSGKLDLGFKRRPSACLEIPEQLGKNSKIPSQNEGSKASGENSSQAGQTVDRMPRVSFGVQNSGTSETSSPQSKGSSIRKGTRFFIPDDGNHTNTGAAKSSIKPLSRFQKGPPPQITVSTSDQQLTTSAGDPTGFGLCSSPTHGSSAEASHEAQQMSASKTLTQRNKKNLVRIKSKNEIFGARGSACYLASPREGISTREQQAMPYLNKLKVTDVFLKRASGSKTTRL